MAGCALIAEAARRDQQTHALWQLVIRYSHLPANNPSHIGQNHTHVGEALAGRNFDPVAEVYAVALNTNQPNPWLHKRVRRDFYPSGPKSTKIEGAVRLDVRIHTVVIACCE